MTDTEETRRLLLRARRIPATLRRSPLARRSPRSSSPPSLTSPTTNNSKKSRLKKEKLRLKDQMEALVRQPPGEPARARCPPDRPARVTAPVVRPASSALSPRHRARRVQFPRADDRTRPRRMAVHRSAPSCWPWLARGSAAGGGRCPAPLLAVVLPVLLPRSRAAAAGRPGAHPVAGRRQRDGRRARRCPDAPAGHVAADHDLPLAARRPREPVAGVGPGDPRAATSRASSCRPTRPESGALNEQSEVWVDHDGRTAVFRQVVGLLARRVVMPRARRRRSSWSGSGSGVMKFGSRMDVFLPPALPVRVPRGRPRRGAATTVLARWDRAMSADGRRRATPTAERRGLRRGVFLLPSLFTSPTCSAAGPAWSTPCAASSTPRRRSSASPSSSTCSTAASRA